MSRFKTRSEILKYYKEDDDFKLMYVGTYYPNRFCTTTTLKDFPSVSIPNQNEEYKFITNSLFNSFYKDDNNVTGGDVVDLNKCTLKINCSNNIEQLVVTLSKNDNSTETLSTQSAIFEDDRIIDTGIEKPVGDLIISDFMGFPIVFNPNFSIVFDNKENTIVFKFTKPQNSNIKVQISNILKETYYANYKYKLTSSNTEQDDVIGDYIESDISKNINIHNFSFGVFNPIEEELSTKYKYAGNIKIKTNDIGNKNTYLNSCILIDNTIINSHGGNDDYIYNIKQKDSKSIILQLDGNTINKINKIECRKILNATTKPAFSLFSTNNDFASLEPEPSLSEITEVAAIYPTIKINRTTCEIEITPDINTSGNLLNWSIELYVYLNNKNFSTID